MRPELAIALAELSECVTLYRAGNPNHKGQGPGGGQFTSQGNGGQKSSNTSTPGKHHAKRQRRKKKRLDALRKSGHARIAQLKAKHSKERKALRDKHRSEGKSYSDRSSETKALRTKHHGESRATIDSIKKEAREAFPKATGASSKSKEFRERVEKANKFEATHGAERTKQAERHDKERQALTADHRTERKAIREAHAKERAQTVEDNNRYHREDAQYIIKETRGQAPEERRKQLEHNKQVHSGRLKDALHNQRQEHAEEHSAHVDEAAGERRDLNKSHKSQRQLLAKAHQTAWRAAREHLVQELKSRSYAGLEQYDVVDASRASGNDHQRSHGVPVSARMGRRRIHKASSAEAILRHCLRQRGWTVQYDGASLTGKQHLNLLEDVRQYGRQWMRHEAESFFDRYGVEIDDNTELRSSRAVGIPTQVLPDLQRSVQADIDGRNRSETVSEMRVVRSIAPRATGAIGRFFDRARGFITELIFAGAMALKGSDQFESNEHAALNNQASIQRQYLDKFEREVQQNPPKEIADLSSVVILVEPQPMTPGQFIARAESYGNSPWEVQNIGREVVRKQEIFKAERRVHLLSLEQHRPCKGGEQGCLEQSRMGWQPIGTLREIGDCFCMGSCDCYFEWQDPKGHIFVSPWGRHNPHGFNVPGSPGAQLPGYAVPSDNPAIPVLPSGPGPAEKPPRKIKFNPRPKAEPKPEPPRPAAKLPNVPTLQELLDEAGSPYAASEYEEA